ncbi:hypothetical protein CNBE4000 [Cryptococcus deneoformans B-3501A]|uniref:Sec20 C-terminal domain-containing protein n=1 Tax=Cryptococcus deneoformans (strain JEC21 / ATCC MYA-565) TaxID=214684 RepID=Q5KGD4_CRYD1|nr:hypothetical protein CNE04010 [Cryptococcus neoformans var. neoformans JEC21]XP_775126.1 hypothetical protein CNBE4000 [Cryptococcus neoformans var. neoformans B-3501A]AAW43724.1 hypothetical protein CNE04010 [Cryptococcus neoformans var. neoformans JEC21]EAL20479.1 hypothetical protein CNBE4000 [Cryptococcus neoformans var. neoformans B-3501A]
MQAPQTSLSDLLPPLHRRLADIQSYQLPRLSTFSGPSDMHSELVDELRTDLESIRHQLGIAKELSLYAPQQTEAQEVEGIEREYIRLKSDFRRAMIDSKKALASRQSRAHELSLKSDLEPNSSTDETTRGGEAKSAAELGIGGDDELQTKTNEVTVALRRTTALMQTELERSVLSVQMLESSTQTMTLTQSLYETYSSLLTSSAQLVRALEKADTMDRLIIFAALFFFLCVVGWVIKRRVLDRTVGVVIGGVGKGVGWYLGGSWRLIRMALSGGSGGSSGRAGLDLADQRIGGGMVDGVEEGVPIPQVGEDSAVGGVKLVADYDDVPPPPAPASQPSQVQGMEEINRINAERRGGKIEVIPNDQGERIVPSWVQDQGREEL